MSLRLSLRISHQPWRKPRTLSPDDSATTCTNKNLAIANRSRVSYINTNLSHNLATSESHAGMSLPSPVLWVQGRLLMGGWATDLPRFQKWGGLPWKDYTESPFRAYLNLSLCVLAICIVLTTSQLYSHQMHFETCKYSKMRLRPGLRPADPAGGAYMQRSPRPPSWI